jgi:PAS domain S-box-containing protein
MRLGDLEEGVETNISQLSDAEERMQAFEANARLAAIVESSQDAIIGKTLAGVIVSWNAAAERLYGYAPEDIIGRNISELIPVERRGELGPIMARVSRGEPAQPFQTQRITKDGKILEMSIAVSPIRDVNGEVNGASTVARDITAITRATSERHALEAQLQRVERLESLGQLAGGVAHDFNNVLAGIMNYSGLVASGLRDQMDRLGLTHDAPLTLILDDVEQITNAARRAADLTRQLLIFSRREVLRPQVLDLNGVVAEMEGLLRRTIGQNVDRLTTVLATDLPLIAIDRGQIEQVIMNLAVNGRDAMVTGGELCIQTSVLEIDERDARKRDVGPGTFVRLSVSDAGTGMSHEVASHAFEPFFTTKPVGEGTGLGLATVFGIVMQAGGEVLISSEVGCGTTIHVDLPVTTESELAADVVSPELSPAAGETILLVEDEQIVREPARRVLAQSGYTVLEASNADEALEIVRHGARVIDLLLTDVVMPGRSGKDLATAVVASSPSTRVLFMSGYSQNVIVHRGVLDPGITLIEKPFSMDELLRKVREVLDGATT